MKVPDPMSYQDLNSDKKFAAVSMEGIVSYLATFEKYFDNTPVSLYKEKYLCYIRMHDSEDQDCYFVKSACRAEMKKSVVYLVDIRVSRGGEILESQCECGAGMGPTAHCKHVCTLLYACYVFSLTGSVNVESTCTEKLQSFHQVKKYTGSPSKARDLEMPGADESTNLMFDPRPEMHRGAKSYEAHFRNTCLNFKGISKMPIFQLFEPANTRAMAHDHDYLIHTHEQTFLEHMGLANISNDRIENIEKRTRGQSANVLWSEERSKRIQSSYFGRICKATSRTDFNKLAESMLEPQQFSSKATDHGKKYEKVATKEYERLHHCHVHESGIWVSTIMPFLGTSPDGVISEDVILEVKCPYTATDKLITPVTVPYLKLQGNGLELDKNHNYFYQVQGQLFCTGRRYCDFLVYTLADVKCIRIERDHAFISSMSEKLEDFYSKYFEPAMLTKFYYRD